MSGQAFAHPDPLGLPPSAAEYCRWTALNCPVVLIRKGVLTDIHAEVLQGLNAVPRRGAEVGGILLGAWSRGAMVIEDFEPVPCEHRFGPSYQLSEADLQNFDETCRWFRSQTRSGLSPVGFYRSHTRPDFGTVAEDERLFSTYFADARQVLLLIKPNRLQHSVADFFVWRDGNIEQASNAQAFPFHDPGAQTAESRGPAPAVSVESQRPRERAPSEPASGEPEPRPRVRHIARVVLDGLGDPDGTPAIDEVQPDLVSQEQPVSRSLPEITFTTEPRATLSYFWWAVVTVLLAVIGGVLGYISVDSSPSLRKQASPTARSAAEPAGRPSAMPAHGTREK